MKKIPTSEELFKEYSELCQFEEGPNEYLVDKDSFKEAMIEFAKLHVEAALKAASEKACGAHCTDYIDKDSILNSYLLDKIK